MTVSTLTEVGRFTFDSTTGTVTGPADYMRSADYAACIRSIESGTSHVFRAGLEHSPSVEVALLVTIQTDYAGWAGREQFNRMRGA